MDGRKEQRTDSRTRGQRGGEKGSCMVGSAKASGSKVSACFNSNLGWKTRQESA